MNVSDEDGYTISDDPDRVDVDVVHTYLRDESYWSTGIPREAFERAFRNSMVLGMYDADGRTAGFARVVTDRATFAWVCDVFILPEYRGKGRGTWLMRTMAGHPDLRGLRRWILATRDAHGLYEKLGFRRLSPDDAARMMIISRAPDVAYGPS